jgi:hypothetical protein
MPRPWERKKKKTNIPYIRIPGISIGLTDEVKRRINELIPPQPM